jgi:hypothetical protein
MRPASTRAPRARVAAAADAMQLSAAPLLLSAARRTRRARPADPASRPAAPAAGRASRTGARRAHAAAPRTGRLRRSPTRRAARAALAALPRAAPPARLRLLAAQPRAVRRASRAPRRPRPRRGARSDDGAGQHLRHRLPRDHLWREPRRRRRLRRRRRAAAAAALQRRAPGAPRARRAAQLGAPLRAAPPHRGYTARAARCVRARLRTRPALTRAAPPPRRSLVRQFELDRRRPGQSRITTPRNEEDTCEILSGTAPPAQRSAPQRSAARSAAHSPIGSTPRI